MWTTTVGLAAFAALAASCSTPDYHTSNTDGGATTAQPGRDAASGTGGGSPSTDASVDAPSADASLERPDAQVPSEPNQDSDAAANKPGPVVAAPPSAPSSPLDGSVEPLPEPDTLAPTHPPSEGPPTPRVPGGPIDLVSPNLGAMLDVPLIGDMDGDGARDDRVVWRPSEGTWSALRSDGTVLFSRRRWGLPGDVPLIGDFDSDGKVNDLGVYRPSEGNWYLMRSASLLDDQPSAAPIGAPIVPTVQWGLEGDVPLVGDFDGDGLFDDLGLWRPAESTWWAKRTDDTIIFTERQWGWEGDVPLVGDFDSDGKVNDLGLFRPSEGKWYFKRWADAAIGVSGVPRGNAIVPAWQLGMTGDIPLAGDFDGDGRFDDFGVWRPSDATWWTKRIDDSTIFAEQQWGFSDDVPLVGDLDSDSFLDDLIVWRPATGGWYAWKTH